MGMLSRTAGSLYWISRYMERAELTSRLLEVGYRIALMPNTTTGYQSEWSSILSAAGEEAGYTSKYGKPQQKDIEQYLFHDLDNPFSVAACIHRARDNGRAVRTALTTQVWDVINSGYQEVQSLARKKYKPSNLPMLCDWTTCQANLLRGAIESTQLEDEGYDFLNLGYFLERAGNTARLLDVKYYVLLPTVSSVGGDVDHYQWTTLLRAMSAYRAFRWAYGGTQTPNKVAHFLILNASCPRSLLHCLIKADYHLNRLSSFLGKETPAQNKVAELREGLVCRDIDNIFEEGLHEFLTRFIFDISSASNAMTESFFHGGL